MKINKEQLKQVIKEELLKEMDVGQLQQTEIDPEFSNYETDDMGTDRQMVSLLNEILEELRTLNYFLTPAKHAAKPIGAMTAPEEIAPPPPRPELDLSFGEEEEV